MKKYDKEVQQAFLDEEKRVLGKLEDSYAEALVDINNKIEMLMARNDADLPHVIYQIEYQRSLKTQVQAVLEQLQVDEFDVISEYLTNSYNNGFIGAMYSMHKQGVPLIIPIDPAQVLEAIRHETKLTSTLYTALGLDIKDLQKKIAGEISRGISSGQGYGDIARNIAAYAKIPMNNAMRIARTESHRIQCKSTLDAQHGAKERGADVVKQWDSTLDGNTRPHHRKLDGQIRELEEPFEVGGMEAMFPGGFGYPEEDCNCRCALLQRARWALDEEELEELQKRAEFFGLDKTEDFNDYRKKYLNAIENLEESSKIVSEALTDNDIKAVYDYMSAKSYVVNEKLRNGIKLSENEQEFITNLDNALEKVPVYEGNLQRSLYFSSDDDVKEFISSYTIGKPITYNEYLSTTKGNVYNPDGQVQIFIQDARNGHDISTLNEGEQEVLYNRGSTFDVINIVNNNGIYYILLGESNE